MSLLTNFMEMSKQEGRSDVLGVAEDVRGSLETICECGNEEEERAGLFLLKRINKIITNLI